MLDAHAKPSAGKPTTAHKQHPTSDVWESMGLDNKLSEKGVQFRKATGKMMDEVNDKLEPYIEATTFPEWIIEKFKALKVNGLNIKGYGSPGLTTTEMGSIIYEIAKRDGSIATFFLVHNAIGMAVVNALGDEEQKSRILPPAVNFDRILAFGLTEPLNGSDASGLLTTATKVEGGYKINGQKRWIGNATFSDVIVWARNTSDGNKV
jgi:alkylation response protein AidB-like acyl-CoA dehydrogenase